MEKLSPQKRAWRTNPKIGSEAILSADFGESFIAYLLSKEGIDVVRANSVGFDLIAIDSDGKIFPKKRYICISVKTRVSKSSNKPRPTIPVGSEKLLKASRIWNADPWVGIVVGNVYGKAWNLEAFIFPLEDLSRLQGTSKRRDVVAVSELYKNPTGRVVKLF